MYVSKSNIKPFKIIIWGKLYFRNLIISSVLNLSKNIVFLKKISNVNGIYFSTSIKKIKKSSLIQLVVVLKSLFILDDR